MEGFLEEITKSIMQQQNSGKKSSSKQSCCNTGNCGNTNINLGEILNGIVQGYVQGAAPPDMSEIVQEFKESPLADIVHALEKEFGMESSKEEGGAQKDDTKNVTKNDTRNDSSKKKDRSQPVHSDASSSLVQSIPSDIRVSFPIDIREMEASCIVYAEIPGADKSTIIVEVEGDNLVVVATKVSYPLGSDDFPCVERSKGVYVRSIKLPASVDKTNISLVVAKYTDGVLSIKMPKVQKQSECRTRRVIVQ
jgi:HSP20 family molecular chaperone IbpA